MPLNIREAIHCPCEACQVYCGLSHTVIRRQSDALATAVVVFDDDIICEQSSTESRLLEMIRASCKSSSHS